MDPASLTPVLRVLRGWLHLLVAALLVLISVRAVTGDAAHAGAIIPTAGALLVVYAAGAALPVVRHSRTVAAGWLGLVGVAWLVLLSLTPDGVWLAFALFFLQLHLLSRRWGVTAVAATTVAAVAGFAWHQGEVTAAMVIGPVLGAAVAVATVLGYQALYRESEARQQLIEELTAARAEVAAAEHTAGMLAERERLAREIHDTLAQGLSSIQLLLRAAERALPDRVDTAQDHVRQARRAATDNLAEARRFVRDWTPPDLEAGSLVTALQRACASAAALSGASVNCHAFGSPVELPTTHEAALLRIAQSALANAGQHAHATRVEVTLSYMDTAVALDVVDDGVGFDPDGVTASESGLTRNGFGLATMRARSRALRGDLAVESSPGAGTAVSITLPYPAADPLQVGAG